MARMCRKFHDHSYSTGRDIGMYISSLFFSIISFGVKKEQSTKASHNMQNIIVWYWRGKKEELKEKQNL